jgi:cytoskeletal protein CcmA (bactofilin family)
VQIAATGRVFGEIVARLISIEEGAEVHARVNMERGEERPRSDGALSAAPKPVNNALVPPTGELARVNA